MKEEPCPGCVDSLPKTVGEEEAAFIRAFIAVRRWRFAKTYAATAPHEYTVREWVMEQQSAFERFTQLIRAYGYEQPWCRKMHVYLNVDGFKYWTMGNPLPETNVINRQPLKGYTDEEKAAKLKEVRKW